MTKQIQEAISIMQFIIHDVRQFRNDQSDQATDNLIDRICATETDIKVHFKKYKIKIVKPKE